MKIKNVLISLLVITSMLMSNVYAADNVANIYVSVNGSDSGDGSYNSPLKTLQAASDKVAEIKGSYSGVNVNIMAGTYNVSDLKFGADDSGSANAKIVWKAYNNDKVVLTSEQKIDNSRITDVNTTATQKIPVRALSNVKQVKLTAEEISAIGKLRYTGQGEAELDAPAYLAQDGKMLEIAGYPNKVYMPIPVTDIRLNDNAYKYTIDDTRVSRWSGAKDAYLSGNPSYEWWDEALKITDITDSVITTSDAGDFGLIPTSGAKLRIVNLVEEIDYPGEFYIDREEGYLYFYPINGIEGSSFSLVTSQKPFATFDGAQHISFENLIFEGTCSTGIIINNSEYITLKDCELKNIGKNAIDIVDSKFTTIDGAHIHDIGKQGITILEEDQEDYLTLTKNENLITNCHIEKYGKMLRRTANAVHAYGLGDTISYNRIHGADHSAIMFGGNDNTIEYNDIYDVLNNVDDAGAIYAGRSWVDGGTKIQYNYIHDNPYTSTPSSYRSGVYLDDSFAGTKIQNNVFANMNAGVMLHGSNYNEIKNNVFINLQSSLRLANPNGDEDWEINIANNAINNLLKNGESFKTNKDYNNLSGYYNAHTLYSRYFAKYDPYDTTGTYNLWKERFGYLDNYIVQGNDHMSPQGNVIQNNATYTGGKTQSNKVAINLATDDIKANNTWDNTNTEVSTSIDVNNNGVLDITDTGIKGETSLTLNNFGVVYPQNNAYVEPGSQVLIWGEDSGAENYHIVIARDESLNDKVFDGYVEDNFYKLEGLTAGSTYYWTVDAETKHHLYTNKTKRVNEGVVKFTVSEEVSVVTLSNIVYRNGDGNKINAIENATVNVVEFDLYNNYASDVTATATLESFNGNGVSIGKATVTKDVKANERIRAGVGITTAADANAYMMLTINSNDCELQYRIDNAAMAGQAREDKLAITSVTIQSGTIAKGSENVLTSVVKSLADGQQNVRCIMATYDSNDMLVASDTDQIILKKGEDHTFNTEALVSSDAGAYVKLFFWNDKMMPLITDYDVQ